MDTYLKDLLVLIKGSLEEEDIYLRSALSGNELYASESKGLIAINNERYYQFIIARYLFKHLRERVKLEHQFTDLVIFSGEGNQKIKVAVEIKRWMSSTGHAEINGIKRDFEKLSRVMAEHKLMLIISSNPLSGPSVTENLEYLSPLIDDQIKPYDWVYGSFETDYKGSQNIFWVAGYEVD